MKKKTNNLKLSKTQLVHLICLMLNVSAYGQGLSTEKVENESGNEWYLTVSMALLFTFMTVFAIGFLARYIRESTGDTFNGYNDSDS